MTYRYKDNIATKAFVSFKGPLNFYKNVKDSYITLEKAEGQQKVFKLELNKIVKGSTK